MFNDAKHSGVESLAAGTKPGVLTSKNIVHMYMFPPHCNNAEQYNM